MEVTSDCQNQLPAVNVVVDYFLGRTELRSEEKAAIDVFGNMNGDCDLGDLRILLGIGPGGPDTLTVTLRPKGPVRNTGLRK